MLNDIWQSYNDPVRELLSKSDLVDYWSTHIVGEKDSQFRYQLQLWANNHYSGGWNQLRYYISELILASQNPHYYELILLLCGLMPDMHFLDAGCGAGQLLKTAHEMGCQHIYGVDVDPIAIHIARCQGLCHHYKPQLYQASIERMDFPATFFDVIVCRAVIMYGDAHKAISELSRCLKIGGRLYVTIHRDKYYIKEAVSFFKKIKPLAVLRNLTILTNARLMQLCPTFQMRTSRTKGYYEHSIPLRWLRKRLQDELFDIEWIGTRNFTTWEVLALKVWKKEHSY